MVKCLKFQSVRKWLLRRERLCMESAAAGCIEKKVQMAVFAGVTDFLHVQPITMLQRPISTATRCPTGPSEPGPLGQSRTPSFVGTLSTQIKDSYRSCPCPNQHIVKTYFRVSYIEIYFLNWLWHIKICKLESVSRWFWCPEIGTSEFHQPV